MKNENMNPCTPEDERNHPLCALEWWCSEGFFKTVEDGKNWHINASITEGNKKGIKKGSVYKTTLFDQKTGKNYESLDYFYKNSDKKNRKFVKKDSIDFNKDGFFVSHSDSYMCGLYPKYKMHLIDSDNDIVLDFKLQAKSLPHWVAQEITDGWLPWGFGYYRYGFIPKLDLLGSMKLKNKTYKIKGIGYLEHVWGDWSFFSQISALSKLKKTISVYTKLGGWWLANNKVNIPNSISFTSENNPIGYDWVWAVLDNGWTIFYGNVMLWVMEGPVAGVLILSKDDKNYIEFNNMSFKYDEIKYSKNYDFYYPSDMELTAKKGKETLYLRFKMTSECREFVQELNEKYWKAFVICEAPGIVEGYYFDGDKKIKLKGFSKIEPQRQISFLGHNSVKIDFIKPPKGVGISFDIDSHYFRKKIFTKIQLAPYPEFNFRVNKIGNLKIH